MSLEALRALPNPSLDGTPVHEFVVEGDPIPKHRARVVHRKGGGVTSFTPKETERYADRVKWSAAAARVRPLPKDRMVGIVIFFRVALHGEPDIDNMEKAILDGLKKLAWTDDIQVRRVLQDKEVVFDGATWAGVRIYDLGPRPVPPEGAVLKRGGGKPKQVSFLRRLKPAVRRPGG